MLVIFNGRALLIGGISIIVGVVLSNYMEWGRNRVERGAVIAFACMFAVDFGWRMMGSKSLNRANNPKILRRKSRQVQEVPAERMNTLFTADYGGQLFWICPVWLLVAVVGIVLLIQQLT